MSKYTIRKYVSSRLVHTSIECGTLQDIMSELINDDMLSSGMTVTYQIYRKVQGTDTWEHFSPEHYYSGIVTYIKNSHPNLFLIRLHHTQKPSVCTAEEILQNEASHDLTTTLLDLHGVGIIIGRHKINEYLNKVLGLPVLELEEPVLDSTIPDGDSTVQNYVVNVNVDVMKELDKIQAYSKGAEFSTEIAQIVYLLKHTLMHNTLKGK